MVGLDSAIEISDEDCPNCGAETYRRDCGCDGGLDGHDCGEDTCCCLNPEDNITCDLCLGRAEHVWCRRCGWDLLEKRFLNGKDERTDIQLAEDRITRKSWMTTNQE